MDCDAAPNIHRYTWANYRSPGSRARRDSIPAHQERQARATTRAWVPRFSFQGLKIRENIVHLLVAVLRQQLFMRGARILYIHCSQALTRKGAVPAGRIGQRNCEFIEMIQCARNSLTGS